MDLDKVYALPPYGLDKARKEALLSEGLCELTRFHYDNCPQYKKILDAFHFGVNRKYCSEDIPFIPVRLFKEYDLLSVPKTSVMKTMTSSGTSGQTVSKIYLDKDNVRSQTKTLAAIITSFIGKQRLPLLILDTEKVKTDRSMFSARGAGIIGFTTFGRDTTYALDADMNLDMQKVKDFINRHNGESILMFGYTYMIWQYVIRELERTGSHLAINDGTLFHIGGWKKLKDQTVDAAVYNSKVKEILGSSVKVYNYYGMAEQLGSVFVECEQGHMHCSIYSDVVIRDVNDFSVMGIGERGLIELLSLLPTSYPGHALLTEDEGEILGIDDCPCGRLGKYFKIYGRVKGAEIRGCSDTYERR